MHPFTLTRGSSALRRAALVGIALLASGCGTGGKLPPQQYPGAAEQLVTPADAQRYPSGTPQAALMKWWRDAQYSNRPGVRAGFNVAVGNRLANRENFDKELDFLAAALRVVKPQILTITNDGTKAVVYTRLVYHQPIGSKNFIAFHRPQAFAMIHRGQRWLMIDDHFFMTTIAPFLDQQTTTGAS